MIDVREATTFGDIRQRLLALAQLFDRFVDLNRLNLFVRGTPDHLSRVFKSQTGDTPSTYYQRRRLQHTVLAVIHSRDTLSEIAYRYGFSDSAHFSHQFHSAYGMSPNRYRKRFIATH